jgi:hypothetical protein
VESIQNKKGPNGVTMSKNTNLKRAEERALPGVNLKADKKLKWNGQFV